MIVDARPKPLGQIKRKKPNLVSNFILFPDMAMNAVEPKAKRRSRKMVKLSRAKSGSRQVSSPIKSENVPRTIMSNYKSVKNHVSSTKNFSTLDSIARSRMSQLKFSEKPNYIMYPSEMAKREKPKTLGRRQSSSRAFVSHKGK